ncbi:MAG TPA: hypothetical protein VFP02_07415 [Acidimicrobiales bacterium]|nr:hypothetical protein [Acidimicrobiales bacterium]
MSTGSHYELVVTGRPGPRVLAALPGFEVLASDGDQTCLRGWVQDQAALQGLMRSLGDLGVAIEGLQRVAPEN